MVHPIRVTRDAPRPASVGTMLPHNSSHRPDANPAAETARPTPDPARARRLRAMITLWFSLLLFSLIVFLHVVTPDWPEVREEPVHSSPALPAPPVAADS